MATPTGVLTTNMDTPLTIVLTGTDSKDVESALTVNVVTLPSHGSVSQVTGPAPLSVVYTAVPAYFGSDTFAFTVTNTAGVVSAGETVSLTVLPANHPPVVSGGSFTLGADGTLTAALNASDADGDELNYALAGTPVG